MKNPFVKENNTAVLIVAALTGALAGCMAVWFYRQNRRAAAAEAERREHAQDYLKPKKPKKHRSDLHDLEEIVHTV